MMVGMDDAEHRPRRKVAWIIAALLGTATLTLYPLSIGPALWLNNQGYISEQTWVVTYFPLLWLVESTPALHGPFTWYMEFWI